MACGLGAVALMFVFVKESTFNPLNSDFSSEIIPIETEIKSLNYEIQNKLDEIENIDNEISNTKKLLNSSSIKINTVNETIDELVNSNKDLTQVLMSAEAETAKSIIPVKKKYISGCNVLGEKIIFLLDVSKSMYAKEVIDIIEYSLLPKPERDDAMKWKNSSKAFRWLVENAPTNSQIFIAGFNTNLIHDAKIGKWTGINSKTNIERQLLSILSLYPDKGTNLQQALNDLIPWSDADSIYLITDGLPTLTIENTNSIKTSRCSKDDYVSGDCRIHYFNEFVEDLDDLFPKVKFNTILYPMKGDPEASFYFSNLSTSTGGCFMTPSANWP